jgi:hypothetical protein
MTAFELEELPMHGVGRVGRGWIPLTALQPSEGNPAPHWHHFPDSLKLRGRGHASLAAANQMTVRVRNTEDSP